MVNNRNIVKDGEWRNGRIWTGSACQDSELADREGVVTSVYCRTFLQGKGMGI